MTTGVIVHGMRMTSAAAYACDITYGTNNELGFDYLRDNMKYSLKEMVQFGGRRGKGRHHFAIVDEVDSILIDEARTPLIISGRTEDRTDFLQDDRRHHPAADEEDYDRREGALMHLHRRRQRAYRRAAQRARPDRRGRSLRRRECLRRPPRQSGPEGPQAVPRDKDYIVKDDKVVLIDEFTGRMMPGRRLSDGLHQAIEAKEGVEIQPENQTLASITFQNYFRLYEKLAGMTGTAPPKRTSSFDIYGLGVVEIPTNARCAHRRGRRALPHGREKIRRHRQSHQDAHAKNQPVLVGTVSIEKSEALSDFLKKKKIKHQVLNARYHEQEAGSSRRPACPGAVTIATNMAGRGTDIQLGGNVEYRLSNGIDAESRRQGARRGRAESQARAKSPRKSPRKSNRRWTPAACSSSAPSAMKAAGSTTSCAAAPAVRATRAAPNSTCRLRTTCCASSRRSAWTPSCARWA
jgi:preprotein translocase subunit SecA